MSDLGLCFSYDEDYLGHVVTHELRPGGKGIAVTNENKIAYVHLMGRFKLYTQIKDQIRAFITGFRTMINPDWMLLFSAPEVSIYCIYIGEYRIPTGVILLP